MRAEFLDRFLSYWRSLAPRERSFMLIGSIFGTLILIYALLWLPLQRDLARLRVQVPKEQEQLVLMRTQATQIKQLRAQTAVPNTGGLLGFIEQSSISAGLKPNIKRVEPDGSNGVRLIVDSVDFNTLVNWLATLHKEGAVRVENATFDAQAAPGVVNARLTLRAIGA